MTEQQLDATMVDNYRQLVESGNRTWSDIAALADQQDAPDLAAYARQQDSGSRSKQVPSAPLPAAQRDGEQRLRRSLPEDLDDGR